jgi:hypothetical protein
MKKKCLILLIIIIVLLGAAFFLKKNSWFQKETTPKDEEIYTEIMDESNLNEEMMIKQNLVVEYLEDNISNLSPEKEVLGGKFYLTSVDFLNDSEAIVSYEDGHIALTAKTTFSLKQNDSQEMEVVIDKFEIIKN